MEATSKLLGRGFNANQLIKKQTISGLRASSGSSATLRNLQRIRLPLRCWARVLSLSDSSSSAGILSLLPLFPLTFKPCAYEQPVISPNHATTDKQKKISKRNVTSVTCNMAMIRGPLPPVVLHIALHTGELADATATAAFSFLANPSCSCRLLSWIWGSYA